MPGAHEPRTCAALGNLRLVGFVIEPDAPEGILIRQLLPANRTPPAGGFVGVVERALAVRILGVVAPALLDWLEAKEGAALRVRPAVYLARTDKTSGHIML